MTAQSMLELGLRELFEAAPQHADPTSVEAAVRTAATLPQRRPRFVLLDPATFPPRRRSAADPALRHGLRLVLIGVLVVAIAAATATVGALLLPRIFPTPPRPISIAPVGSVPVAARTAIALEDGRLVVAGFTTERTLAVLIDPVTAQIATISATEAPVTIVTSRRLPDGSVVLAGRSGDGQDGKGSPHLWILDRAGASVVHTFDVPSFTDESRIAVTDDGRIVVISLDATSAEPRLTLTAVDPGSGTASTLTPVALPAMGLGFDAVALPGNRLLVVNGWSPNERKGQVIVDDLANGAQRAVGTLQRDRFYERTSPVLLADGRVLLIGGTASTACAQMGGDPVVAAIFDPATELLAESTLPHAVGSATALPDGRVVVTGTWTAFDGGCAGERIEDDWIAIYDPLTGQTVESLNPLTGQGDLPVDVADGVVASVLLEDGSVALIGSDDEASNTPIDLFIPGDRAAD